MNNPLFTPKIYQQVDFLTASFWFGLIIYFVYDNIRVFRRCFPHGIVWISIEDLLYWICVSISFFLLQHHENSGVFRWFSIIGVMVGMGLWRLTGSRFYVNRMSKLLLFLLKLLYRGTHFILSPLFFVEKKTKAGIKCGMRKSKRLLRFMRNRLTRTGKMIKITLCKRKKKGARKKERTINREKRFQNS